MKSTMNLRSLRTLACVALVWGCGGTDPLPVGEPKPHPQPSGGEVSPLFKADDQTPGFFRNMYRMASAQALLDDETAVERLLIELPARFTNPGELPPLTESERATMDGLLVLAIRAVQAAKDTPGAARRIGDGVLELVLGIDPARRAWNAEHVDALVSVTEPGALTLVTSAHDSMDTLTSTTPTLCKASAASAVWTPGPYWQRWVDAYCEADEWVDGYCEPDTWYEGDCYDVWIPEECAGGYYRDDGSYQYRCYSDDDCEYVWVSRWTYVQGNCTSGYWDEDCSSGYWEPGICYGGYWEPGVCVSGHWLTTYPSGTWSYQAVSAPAECSVVRPAQYAIALSAVEALVGTMLDSLAPEWAAAAERVLADGAADEVSEGKLAALLEILDAVAP
jgi:hypothetical protein